MKAIAFPVLFLSIALVACDSDSSEIRISDRGLTVSALGRVETKGRVRELTARRGGVLKEILVSEGEMAEIGQRLASLVCKEEEAAVEQAAARIRTAHASLQELLAGTRVDQLLEAEARLDAATHRYSNALEQYERHMELASRGLSSEQLITELRTAADEAKALVAASESFLRDLKAGPRTNEIDLARALLDEAKASHNVAMGVVNGCGIYAPIRGQVLKVYRSPGEYVSPQAGDVVLVFGDTENLVIRAEFDERDAGRLSVGQPVTVSTIDRSATFSGHLIEMPLALGRTTIKSLDPEHRFDNDIVETVIEVQDVPVRLFIGQQMIVEFSR